VISLGVPPQFAVDSKSRVTRSRHQGPIDSRTILGLQERRNKSNIMSTPPGVVAYNGTTGKADSGRSSGVSDLNIFYDVRSPLNSFTTKT
jgi:hypothetical protein